MQHVHKVLHASHDSTIVQCHVEVNMIKCYWKKYCNYFQQAIYKWEHFQLQNFLPA